MTDHRISVRQWLENWKAGKYSQHISPWDIKAHRQAACDAGWYDWFCDDKRLFAKTQKLGKLVEQLAKSEKIDLDRMYVWFKNNCPMAGSLYDDIRFADLETHNTAYVVVPKNGFTKDKNKSFVYAESAAYEAVAEGTWKNVKAYFGV